MPLRPSLTALVLAIALAPGLPALAQDHSGHAMGGHADHAMQAPATITLGDIVMTGPFTRATLPNAPVAGGFLTLTNNGTEDDRLIAATSTIARETQIHEMAMENDVMKMRQLAEGLVIPAGESVVLAPGGFHLMFMGLNQALVEGESVAVTLTFERAGEITIDLAVAGSAADAPAHGGMNHGDMNHGEMNHDAMSPDAHAGHGTGMAVDQAGLSDIEAITAMQKAMFDTPGNPLAMGPIVVSKDYAISGWAQNDAGGRALLRKTATGWGIHLCAGAGLKDEAELVKIGVPVDVAADLAAQLAAAEAQLPAETVALYDSFDGTMMVDEDLI